MHRVFVTGGTGFVGRVVVHTVRADTHIVRCLVRRGSERDLRGFESIERVEGDVLSPKTLEAGMDGCDTVIHLVGIIREHRSRGITFERLHETATRNVLDAAKHTGVRRIVHMSALGTRPDARSRYHQTKWRAEEAVRASGLPWTIFRPAIIYGRGDGFVTPLAGVVRRAPIVPVIGTGENRLQPVPVEHVAEGFARAVDDPATAGRTFDVCGPDAVTLNELIDMIGRVLGRRHVRKVRMPMGPLKMATRALQRLPGYPVTSDQLVMLEEDNPGDPEPFVEAFDLTPVPLAIGLEAMLGR